MSQTRISSIVALVTALIVGGWLIGAALWNRHAALYIAGVVIVTITGLLAVVAVRQRRTLAGRSPWVIAAIVVAGLAAVLVPFGYADATKEGDDDIIAEWSGFELEQASSAALAWPAGEAVVMRSNQGQVGLVAEGSRELVDIGVEAGSVFISSGPVAVIHVSDEVVAISRDGSELWRHDDSSDIPARSAKPLAAFPDGTVVLRYCGGETTDGPSCDLVAIEVDGDERWSVEAPSATTWPPLAFVNERDAAVERIVPTQLLSAVRGDDPDSSARSVQLYDPESGAPDTVGEGVSIASGDGYFSIADRRGDDCIIDVFASDGEALFTSTVDGAGCPPMGLWSVFGDRLAWSIEQSHMLDVTTERLVTLDVPDAAEGAGDTAPTWRPTAAGFIGLVDDQWEIGVDTDAVASFVVPGDWMLAGIGSEGLAFVRPVPSRNPFVPADLHEIEVLDPETGDRCASMRVRGENIVVAAMAKCRAVVSVSGSGTTTLIG